MDPSCSPEATQSSPQRLPPHPPRLRWTSVAVRYLTEGRGATRWRGRSCTLMCIKEKMFCSSLAFLGRATASTTASKNREAAIRPSRSNGEPTCALEVTNLRPLPVYQTSQERPAGSAGAQFRGTETGSSNDFHEIRGAMPTARCQNAITWEQVAHLGIASSSEHPHPHVHQK